MPVVNGVLALEQAIENLSMAEQLVALAASENEVGDVHDLLSEMRETLTTLKDDLYELVDRAEGDPSDAH